MQFFPISDLLNYKNILCSWNNDFIFRLKCKTKQDYINVIKHLEETNKIKINNDMNLVFNNEIVKKKFIQDLQRL